ncbi:MAG: hypothetical protein HUJ26_02470 [Planctomycetaceae bacterium]|nr:hypothetical protein [Planctomycetaceae bacterium]
MNSIQCPYCHSDDHRVIDDHIYRCDDCHRYFGTDEDGNAVELSPDLPIEPQNLGKS